MEHTIAFDSGETATVKLKEVHYWTVKEAEIAILSEPGVLAAIRDELEPQLLADTLGRADKALPEGTRICVAGRGRGAYVSFGKKTFGANEHTIAFDSGETAVVNLKEVDWTVKESEMDAMVPPLPPVLITVTTLEQRTIKLEVSPCLVTNAVKAIIEEKAGIPVARDTYTPLGNTERN